MILLWAVLAVSAVSLILQAAAAGHHHRAQNGAVSGTRRVVVRGYARSAGLHGAVACGYLTVISLQAAGVRLPGHGLSAESLLAFAGTQAAGLVSSALDLGLHRRLAGVSGKTSAVA